MKPFGKLIQNIKVNLSHDNGTITAHFTVL